MCLFATLSVCMLSVGHRAAAQSQAAEKTVTIKVANASLVSVLLEVRRQSGVRLVYSDSELQKAQPVTVSLTGQPLSRAMDAILKGQPFSWKRDGDAIVVSPVREQAPRGQAPATAKRTIQGRITNAAGEPLPGATVVYQEYGAVSDGQGNFTISVPSSCEYLDVSFIGFNTLHFALDGRSQVNIALTESAHTVDDVVVTGYFTKSKESFTGAVTSIKREDLRKFGNANLLEAIQLSDPSFKIKMNNERGSDPNTLPEFFIRGESSFMGSSNLPTFIVDGYEVTVQKIFDMDMDRIESLTILKDASATILYGSRAANGVIVIETRRPTSDRLEVSYNGRFSLSVPDLSDYNLMNAREKLEYEVKAGVFSDYNEVTYADFMQRLEAIKANVARGVDTDWLAQPVRNAFSQSHNLYLEGGSDKIKYGLNGNYARTNGVMKDSYRETFGIAFDLTYRLKDKLSIRNSFEYGQTNVQNSPYGSFSLYAAANPYNPVYGEDGWLMTTFTVHPNTTTTAQQYQNPLYNASLPYKDEAAYTTLTNNLSVDYYFTPGLRFKGSLALTKGLESSDKFVSPNNAEYQLATNLDQSQKGKYTQGTGNSFAYNLNAMLTYNLTYNRHIFFSGAGLNVIDDRATSGSVVGLGFLSDNFMDLRYATGTLTPSGSEQHSRMAGFFANVNYSYDNRYFADFSWRTDGSSKFGTERRFAPFWSVGAGWNLNREHFMKNVKWLTTFKLRGSVGSTGNQSFDSYQARTMLQYSNTPYLNALGAWFRAYGNTALEWQTTLKKNAGIDLEVLDRRLAARFDYYDNQTKSLLIPMSTAPSAGFSQYTENMGEQTNHGYEFDITAVIVRRPNFDWAVNFSGTHNVTRITKISDALREFNKQTIIASDLTSPLRLYEEGKSPNALWVAHSLGINPATGKEIFRTRFGTISETWNAEDLIAAGVEEPGLSGHFGTNVMWKNLTLNLTFDFSFGGQVYNQTLVDRVEGADPKTNADKRVIEKRWQQPGDVTFYKDIADRTKSNATSRFVQDNDYVEFGNVSLSYRLAAKSLKKIGLSSLRLGLNSNSLFYVSTVRQERGLGYPYARTYTFSVNLNF